MNWFELQAPELDYKNLMGSWRNGESSPYGLLDLSFSDVPLWIYVAVLALAFLIARVVFNLVSGLSEKHASHCRMALVLIGVLCFYGSYAAMLLWNVPWVSIPQAIREGVFGDSFGTLNTLFSGLAFAGVLITLLFQRRDLSDTRKQIADQNIESQFYSMLSHQQDIVRSFDLQQDKTKQIIAEGRDCFRYWDKYLTVRYYIFSRVPVVLNAHCHSYNQIFLTFRADLGLYYRSLYSVFRFIDNSNHPNTTQFALHVRSLISDYELKMIFYNCLTPQGEKFIQYVYRFGLFDNLDETILLDQDHINYFTYEAYGSNRRLIEKLKAGPPSK